MGTVAYVAADNNGLCSVGYGLVTVAYVVPGSNGMYSFECIAPSNNGLDMDGYGMDGNNSRVDTAEFGTATFEYVVPDNNADVDTAGYELGVKSAAGGNNVGGNAAYETAAADVHGVEALASDNFLAKGSRRMSSITLCTLYNYILLLSLTSTSCRGTSSLALHIENKK